MANIVPLCQYSPHLSFLQRQPPSTPALPFDEYQQQSLFQQQSLYRQRSFNQQQSFFPQQFFLQQQSLLQQQVFPQDWYLNSSSADTKWRASDTRSGAGVSLLARSVLSYEQTR